MLDICREAGFSPRAVQEDVWLVHTIIGLVAAGIGVALVPASAQLLRRRGLVYRALQGRSRHEVELAAARRRDDRSAVLAGLLAQVTSPRR